MSLSPDDLGPLETEALAAESSPAGEGSERQEALFEEIAEELAEREAMLAAVEEGESATATATALEPSAADFARETREALDRLAESLNQRLAGLQTQFDREVRAEATRERIVDRLHAELQEYKQDLLLKIQRPIFVDLIQLHDDIGKMARATGDESDERGAAFRGTLESIQVAIEDVLYRQGVEPFRGEGEGEGEAFDPRRQRALTTVPTDREELAKTIAERLRPGFQAGDKVIRPELVSVYTLAK